MNVLSLFDGISAGQIALNRAGIEYNKYYAYEIDGTAIRCTRDNFPATIHMGNVLGVLEHNLKDIDLIIGGPECQSYSVAGKMDASSLWQIELFKKCIDTFKPKYYLMENVGSKKSIVNEIDKIMGGHVCIDSKYFSAQNRFRRYWTNIPIMPYEDKNILLSDISATSDDIPICFSSSGRGKHGIERRLSCNKKAHTLTATGYSNRSFSGFITKKREIRAFTRAELEYLQTFPIGYTKSLTDRQAIKALGNSWTVDVIAHILMGIQKI